MQICQEADQVVWYSSLFKNFPQFVVIHTVRGFGIVNKAKVHVFLELPCFFDDPMDVVPGEPQGQGSLVGCRPWGHTESDITEAT